MITITRSLARQVRAILKRTLNVPPRRPSPPVTFHAGSDGLSIRAAWSDAAADYHVAGDLPPQQISVPLDFLAHCEGRHDEEVQLERTADQVTMCWSDEGMPQRVQCDAVEPALFPEYATGQVTSISNSPELISALADAMATTDRTSARYAVDKVQLQGKTGSVAATDGRQLLIQRSFEFPWDEDLLIPQTTVFSCKQLPSDQPVEVFRQGKWVYFRIGPWTLAFAGDAESRFPDVENRLPQSSDATSRLELDDADARFLTKSLRRLPTSDDSTKPVTVELNGQVVLRAQSELHPKPTELILKRSRAQGEEVRINTNRSMLARAVAIGFREFHLFGPESPVLCQDGRRSYLWALLSAESAVKPNAEAVRIESPTTPVPSKPRTHRNRRSRNSMTTNHTRVAHPKSKNGKEAPDHLSVEDLINQAEVVRSALREAVAKTSEVIAGLKRHRKQSRLVKSTLASLRQLQVLDA